jgi:hypothetical protein
LWHLLQESYAEPDDFVLQLNAAIEGFRNVTFILQNEMNVVPDAKEWYEEWQGRMRSDPIMKWLHDSRTTVVHKGDLETHSTATAGIRANWLGPWELGTMEVPPLMPTDVIAVLIKDAVEPGEELRREGVLEVERRWVEKGLPDDEILGSLAHCFGVLWTLLGDAHGRCGVTMSDVHGDEHLAVPNSHLENQPDCMIVERHLRTVFLHLGTGDLLTRGSAEIEYDPDIGERARERYGLDELKDRFAEQKKLAGSVSRDEHFLSSSAALVEMGRRMLAKDGYHETMAFLHAPNGKSENIAIRVEDQQDKYLVMERIAERVRLMQADQVFYITESWFAPEDSVAQGQRAGESVERKEALYFLAVTARGPNHSREWFIPFTRDADGSVELEATHEGPPQFPLFLAPIFAVWAELYPCESPGHRTAQGTA